MAEVIVATALIILFAVAAWPPCEVVGHRSRSDFATRVGHLRVCRFCNSVFYVEDVKEGFDRPDEPHNRISNPEP